MLGRLKTRKKKKQICEKNKELVILIEKKILPIKKPKHRVWVKKGKTKEL